jgi:kynurenine formamidase
VSGEYCQTETLSDLDQLPAPTGVLVSALPVRLEAASAAWARVVTIFES